MERLTDKQKNEKKGILELYSCIQTEGSKAGFPNILVRFTGCTHRCYFGEGGFCDSWYTSWSPEKSSFSINDVEEFIKNNLHIKHMMITGGSPTMHPKSVNELIHLMHKYHGDNAFITLETEGSHFISTDYKIDLISLSPKFSNSRPILGLKTPTGKEITQKDIERHEEYRLRYTEISRMINYHKDYHFKPVWSPNSGDSILEEIEEFRQSLNIPLYKTWLMPGGDNREELIKVYPIVINKCIKLGYNFSGRDHIIAFDIERGV